MISNIVDREDYRNHIRMDLMKILCQLEYNEKDTVFCNFLHKTFSILDDILKMDYSIKIKTISSENIIKANQLLKKVEDEYLLYLFSK
jgi:hypothetical protein